MKHLREVEEHETIMHPRTFVVHYMVSVTVSMDPLRDQAEMVNAVRGSIEVGHPNAELKCAHTELIEEKSCGGKCRIG